MAILVRWFSAMAGRVLAAANGVRATAAEISLAADLERERYALREASLRIAELNREIDHQTALREAAQDEVRYLVLVIERQRRQVEAEIALSCQMTAAHQGISQDRRR